jgi:hypothetical protein
MTRNEREANERMARAGMQDWSALTCGNCRCTSADIKAAGGKCPRSVPTTEPGELDALRERRTVRGSGLVMAVLLVVGAISIGCALALAFNGWR